MPGWGDFFGGLMDKIPIQGRIERWKNEKDNLETELAKLKIVNLDFNRKEDREKAKRIDWITARIAYLSQLLINKNS